MTSKLHPVVLTELVGDPVNAEFRTGTLPDHRQVEQGRTVRYWKREVYLCQRLPLARDLESGNLGHLARTKAV